MVINLSPQLFIIVHCAYLLAGIILIHLVMQIDFFHMKLMTS